MPAQLRRYPSGPSRFARRRLLAAGVVAAAVSLAAGCNRPAARTYRVGMLLPGPPPGDAAPSSTVAAFIEGMRELGYEEGRNLVLLTRYADGRRERLAAFARELVDERVDVIFAANTVAAVEAHRATTTIPIVMGSAADPVAAGVITSVSRPGKNVTGLTLDTPDVTAKRLEILRALVPRAKQIAAFHPAELRGFAVVDRWLEECVRSGGALGFEPIPVDLPYDPTLWDEGVRAARVRLDAGTILETSQYLGYRRELAAVMLKHRMPVVFPFAAHVEVGGLVAYGADPAELWRRAASYVDRILKGADPASLPVEMPTRFDLAINVATAHAMGLEIPDALKMRARVVTAAPAR